MMNQEQLQRMISGKGFIAALDQSDSSTSQVKENDRVPSDSYPNEQKMHALHLRILTHPHFNGTYILGVILSQNMMDCKIEGEYVTDYLWHRKRILSFSKIDAGLTEPSHQIQRMTPINDLEMQLSHAKERHVFGTGMRSVIHGADVNGIQAIVDQQFALARQIAKAGLVPVLEPEIDIHISDKAGAEKILHYEIAKQFRTLPEDMKIILRISIPTVTDTYLDLMEDSHVVRIIALSGGYSQKEANHLLSQNKGLIASFSRAFTEGLSTQQSDEAFDKTLQRSIHKIYEASNS